MTSTQTNTVSKTTASKAVHPQAKVVLSTDQQTLGTNSIATLTFTFNTAPVGFSLDDIKVTNGVVTALKQDPVNSLVYTAQFMGGTTSHSGMSTIKLEGPYADAAGGAGTPSNTVTIKNIDKSIIPTVGFVSNNMAVAEGHAGKTAASFDLVLSSAVNEAVTVFYSTDVKTFGAAKAGSDFAAKTASVVFAPGETRKSIAIDIIGDKDVEASETFYVDITGAKGATVVTNGAEGLRSSWVAATIANDDLNPTPTVGFASNNTSIVEGHDGKKLLQMAVKLSAAATREVTVDYSTELKTFGTAKAGVDYVPVKGTLSFAPGETSKLISVEIIGDTQYESNEYFYVDLVSANGADVVLNGAEGLRNSWVMATIQNDDKNPLPTVGFAQNNQSILEGNSGTKLMQFTVSLSAAATQEVAVQYSTEHKTFGTAKSFQDYVPTSGKLVFGVGEISKTISVEVVGDTAYEASEYFYLDLVSATGADIVVNGAEGLRNSWVMASIGNDDSASAKGQVGAIVGTANRDTLGGSAHADIIDGRGGMDLLTGSAGADTFAFSAAYASTTSAGAARVMDFKDGLDLIGLRGGLKFSDLVVSAAKSGEGAVVSLANGDILAVLVGVKATTIDGGDFVQI